MDTISTFDFLNTDGAIIHRAEFGLLQFAEIFARTWNRSESATNAPRSVAIITHIVRLSDGMVQVIE